MKFSTHIMVLALVLTAACTKKVPVADVGLENRNDLISNRPIGATPELFVVTLASPALLAAAQSTPGGITIPETAKQAVLNEQTQFEQKLKSIAPQAQIVYRYRLTLNGLAVFATSDVAPVILGLSGVRSVEAARPMARPEAVLTEPAPPLSSSTNSVSFIGGDKARQLGFTGKGLRVGILDTGVDYTHAMLGGSGSQDEFKGVDPALPSHLFPNSKVTGGLDLVGSEFDASSPLSGARLPKPDTNPIDEAGHGTHVAGSVAGLGDGQNTYSGVAPDAEIYAIKVFGKSGATADAVVISGFEFAADPNGDLNPDDRLDVVNLSLGGGFGQPQILYNEAVRNLIRAGTFVVASAGNSGPTQYIVGAPSTADEALSVAASIDGSPHTWQFDAVRFIGADGAHFAVKAIEGPISTPISEISIAEGPLVYIGLADQDLTDPEKAALNGKVALIMRGKVPFADKLKRAVDAGAVGAVVMNNEAGNNAFPMGGSGRFAIPAVMVGHDTGARILEDLKKGEVRIQFKTTDRIFEPAVIDTITSFSSQGPRSEDNLFKPEIAAPGDAIISAKMGGGAAGVKMSGTSMSAPHMSGVVAVVRQARPELSPLDIKNLLMSTAKVLSGAEGGIPFTLQGTGRVQVDKALASQILVSPAALSLGRIQVGSSQKIVREISVRNLTGEDLSLHVLTDGPAGLRITVPAQITISAGGQISFPAEIDVEMRTDDMRIAELNGQIQFVNNGQILGHVSILAIALPAARLQAQPPSETELKILNSSPMKGFAFPFNLIGEDDAKPAPSASEAWKSRGCDLVSVGYRIVQKLNDEGVPTEYLQLGYKLRTPVTTWIGCEVTALIDVNGDGVADQELAGSNSSNLEGSGVNGFYTMLLDSARARELRLAYEADLSAGKPGASVDYSTAILNLSPMAPFPQSTIAITEVPLSRVGKGADGKIHLKLATLGSGMEFIEADDYLGVNLGNWLTIPTNATEQGYKNLPEVVEVGGRAQSAFALEKGTGADKLVIYYPNNEFLMNGADNQGQVF